MKKLLHHIPSILFLIFTVLVLTVSLRGNLGTPNAKDLNTPIWKENGPFELSPERGRFALTYSLSEDKSQFFSVPVARFAIPDLGYKNGHYVSLFAPAVSYIVMPGYMIGKALGASQVGTFAVIALFAAWNALLIRSITKKLGAQPAAADIGALVFLFATPAFSYGVNLYQHHISTFLILMSIRLLLGKHALWKTAVILFLCAASIPVDYPNLFLMLPIGIYALAKLVETKKDEGKIRISMNIYAPLTFLAIILPLAFFLWFNQISYGNPLQFSGTVPSAKEIDAQGKPTAPKTADPQDIERYTKPDTQSKSAVRFFKARNLINGLYLHLLSPDRGIVYFTPVIVLGIAGAAALFPAHQAILAVLVGVIAFDLTLYSLWGDPWGGWAFGSRYLVPGYSILAMMLSMALSRWRKNIVFLVIFIGLAVFSVSVNTAGALSSSANPPKVEVLALEQLSGHEEKYTYQRNLDFLRKGDSKSFVFRSFASKYIPAWNYYLVIAGTISIVLTLLSIALYLGRSV